MTARSMFALALSASISLTVAAAGGAQTHPNDYSDGASWLCRPGRRDGCATDLTTTFVGANGAFVRQTYPPNSRAPIDCFYVYPTVSTDTTWNSSMSAGAAEVNAAAQQFARFGAMCRLFAPLYRQVTLAGRTRLMTPGDTAAAANAERIGAEAYADVRDAWRYYLARLSRGHGAHQSGRGAAGDHWRRATRWRA